MKHNNIPGKTNSRITIYDIAKEVGITAGTVGRALNGTGRVSKETRKLVIDTAAKMGYQPSLVARSLSQNRTYTLGILVPMIGDTAYSAMVNGIEDVAYSAGYNVILCSSQLDLRRHNHYLEMLQSRRVEGIIAIPSTLVDENEIALLTKIEESGIPVIVLEQNIPDDNLTKVVADNFGGAKKITNHLIDLGHRRIGFLHLGLGDRDYPGNERLAGYKAAMTEAGLGYDGGLVAGADTRPSAEDDGHQPVRFDTYYEAAGRPTAVFASCDMLAIKIIQACHQIGIRVPEDIAIVGFDDLVVSAYVTPALTTVHQPAVEMGKRAAGLLMSRIEGKLKYAVQERIQGQLIVRQSCGAALSNRMAPGLLDEVRGR